MDDQHLSGTDPHRLASLFAFGGEEKNVWSEEDFAPMLQHQLAATVKVELMSNAPPSSSSMDSGTSPTLSLRDLLAAEKPPVELLRRLKEFAKSSIRQSDSSLPDEVATVLYFSAIAAAQLKCGEQISGLSADGLRHGYQWAHARTWLTPELASLFETVTV